MQSKMDTETGEMIVKRVSVPIGLEELMEGLVKEVLLKKPDDIYLFAARYFAHLLSNRDKSQIPHCKAKTLRSVQTLKDKPEPVKSFRTSKLSKQLSIREDPLESPIVSQKPKMYHRNELKYKRRHTGPPTNLDNNQKVDIRRKYARSVSTEKQRPLLPLVESNNNKNNIKTSKDLSRRGNNNITEKLMKTSAVNEKEDENINNNNNSETIKDTEDKSSLKITEEDTYASEINSERSEKSISDNTEITESIIKEDQKDEDKSAESNLIFSESDEKPKDTNEKIFKIEEDTQKDFDTKINSPTKQVERLEVLEKECITTHTESKNTSEIEEDTQRAFVTKIDSPTKQEEKSEVNENEGLVTHIESKNTTNEINNSSSTTDQPTFTIEKEYIQNENEMQEKLTSSRTINDEEISKILISSISTTSATDLKESNKIKSENENVTYLKQNVIMEGSLNAETKEGISNIDKKEAAKEKILLESKINDDKEDNPDGISDDSLELNQEYDDDVFITEEVVEETNVKDLDNSIEGNIGELKTTEIEENIENPDFRKEVVEDTMNTNQVILDEKEINKNEQTSLQIRDTDKNDAIRITEIEINKETTTDQNNKISVDNETEGQTKEKNKNEIKFSSIEQKGDLETEKSYNLENEEKMESTNVDKNQEMNKNEKSENKCNEDQNLENQPEKDIIKILTVTEKDNGNKIEEDIVKVSTQQLSSSTEVENKNTGDILDINTENSDNIHEVSKNSDTKVENEIKYTESEIIENNSAEDKTYIIEESKTTEEIDENDKLKEEHVKEMLENTQEKLEVKIQTTDGTFKIDSPIISSDATKPPEVEEMRSDSNVTTDKTISPTLESIPDDNSSLEKSDGRIAEAISEINENIEQINRKEHIKEMSETSIDTNDSNEKIIEDTDIKQEEAATENRTETSTINKDKEDSATSKNDSHKSSDTSELIQNTDNSLFAEEHIASGGSSYREPLSENNKEPKDDIVVKETDFKVKNIPSSSNTVSTESVNAVEEITSDKEIIDEIKVGNGENNVKDKEETQVSCVDNVECVIDNVEAKIEAAQTINNNESNKNEILSNENEKLLKAEKSHEQCNKDITETKSAEGTTEVKIDTATIKETIYLGNEGLLNNDNDFTKNSQDNNLKLENNKTTNQNIIAVIVSDENKSTNNKTDSKEKENLSEISLDVTKSSENSNKEAIETEIDVTNDRISFNQGTSTTEIEKQIEDTAEDTLLSTVNETVQNSTDGDLQKENNKSKNQDKPEIDGGDNNKRKKREIGETETQDLLENSSVNINAEHNNPSKNEKSVTQKTLVSSMETEKLQHDIVETTDSEVKSDIKDEATQEPCVAKEIQDSEPDLVDRVAKNYVTYIIDNDRLLTVDKNSIINEEDIDKVDIQEEVKNIIQESNTNETIVQDNVDKDVLKENDKKDGKLDENKEISLTEIITQKGNELELQEQTQENNECETKSENIVIKNNLINEAINTDNLKNVSQFNKEKLHEEIQNVHAEIIQSIEEDASDKGDVNDDPLKVAKIESEPIEVEEAITKTIIHPLHNEKNLTKSTEKDEINKNVVDIKTDNNTDTDKKNDSNNINSNSEEAKTTNSDTEEDSHTQLINSTLEIAESGLIAHKVKKFLNDFIDREQNNVQHLSQPSSANGNYQNEKPKIATEIPPVNGIKRTISFDSSKLKEELKRVEEESKLTNFKSSYNPYLLRKEIQDAAKLKTVEDSVLNSDENTNKDTTSLEQLVPAVITIQSSWKRFKERKQKQKTKIINEQGIPTDIIKMNKNNEARETNDAVKVSEANTIENIKDNLENNPENKNQNCDETITVSDQVSDEKSSTNNQSEVKIFEENLKQAMEHTDSNIIQNNLREKRSITENLDFGATVQAALAIQRMWRGYRVRKTLTKNNENNDDKVQEPKKKSIETPDPSEEIPQPMSQESENKDKTSDHPSSKEVVTLFSKDSSDSVQTVIHQIGNTQSPLQHYYSGDMDHLLDEILDYPTVKEEHLLDDYQSKLLDKISGKENENDEDIKTLEKIISPKRIEEISLVDLKPNVTILPKPEKSDSRDRKLTRSIGSKLEVLEEEEPTSEDGVHKEEDSTNKTHINIEQKHDNEIKRNDDLEGNSENQPKPYEEEHDVNNKANIKDDDKGATSENADSIISTISTEGTSQISNKYKAEENKDMDQNLDSTLTQNSITNNEDHPNVINDLTKKSVNSNDDNNIDVNDNKEKQNIVNNHEKEASIETNKAKGNAEDKIENPIENSESDKAMHKDTENLTEQAANSKVNDSKEINNETTKAVRDIMQENKSASNKENKTDTSVNQQESVYPTGVEKAEDDDKQKHISQGNDIILSDNNGSQQSETYIDNASKQEDIEDKITDDSNSTTETKLGNSNDEKLYTFCSVPTPIPGDGKPSHPDVEILSTNVSPVTLSSESKNESSVEDNKILTNIRNQALVIPLPLEVQKTLKGKDAEGKNTIAEDLQNSTSLENVSSILSSAGMNPGDVHETVILPINHHQSVDIGKSQPVAVQLCQTSDAENVTSLRPPSTADVTDASDADAEDRNAQNPGKVDLPAKAESSGCSDVSLSQSESMESEKRRKIDTSGKNMEAEAATKIQAGFRGYQVRKQLKNKNGSSDMNTRRPSLKSKTSGPLDTKNTKNQSQKSANIEEQSAVKIQAGVRGFLVRRRQKKDDSQHA
ncbi:protein PFC0760c [Diabrotica virgifera virgifera]|uniref:Protein PFC0760c-like isoform X2 n=1 Tax=Diabrotica virgifera virgifera TaxID=50390 RepID=A0A6P7GWH9_DIAVI|nr:protein PFC0760c [Diabrotica virgifera virgifera]